MNAERTIVCIAGMHRSGTSMVAHLLHLCGLFLGKEDDLWGATRDNPEGHWENVRLLQINDEILNGLGGGWDCPPTMPGDFQEDLRFVSLAARARTIQQQSFPGNLWGWKDPRNSLTLPFWQSLWPDLKTVICVRNPLEVAVSLRRRGLSSYAFGLNLWKVYNQRLLETAPLERRIVTHYDAYFADSEAEIRRVLGFLEIPVSDESLKRCCASIKSEHRHNRFTNRQLFDLGVAPDVLQLYLSLCAEAGWSEWDSLVSKASPVAPSKMDANVPFVDASSLELELSRRDLQTLRARAAGHETTILDLRAQLADLAERAKRSTEVVVARDKSIKELQAKLAEAAERNKRDEEKVKEREAKLDELQKQLAAAMDRSGHQSQNLAERDKAIQILQDQIRLLQAIGGKLDSVLQNQKRCEYREFVREFRNSVCEAVPEGASLLVVSKGDNALLELDGRKARHFPGNGDGSYSGYYPADSTEAIAELERMRAKGVDYLLFPSTAAWWLDYYVEFRRHLDAHHARLPRADDTCVIYALRQNGKAVAP